MKCIIVVPFRYPVKRGNYSTILDSDLDYFRKVVGEAGVVTSDLDGYNTDWLGEISRNYITHL